jgi:ABC-2 type transport system ATP-binding protein
VSSVVLAEALTKDFQAGFWRRRAHRALDALSIEIPAGTVFGLLGPNGAGKSTTLKLLLNLIWPTAGRAQVLGHPPGAVAARQRLGFLPENPTFYDRLTAEEIVMYFAGLFGRSAGAARRRAGEVLDLLGVGPERRRPLRQFSKGMMQRVGLAQALVNDPELIILDEPMSGLDPVGRRDVRNLILALRDQGRTILFSSHVLSDAELLCSRVGILARGRLVTSGSVTELTDRASSREGDGGWEIVMSGLSSIVVERLRQRVARTRKIADGRYSLELQPGDRPEALIAELASTGGCLISLARVSASLEDVLLSAVAQQQDAEGAGAYAGTFTRAAS